MDLAVFTAMNVAPSGDLGFDELAEVIIAQAQESLGTSASDALTDAFTRRGVLPRCNRVLEFEGKELNGPAGLGGAWFALGTQSTSLSETGYSPGVVQFHATVPAQKDQLTVAFAGQRMGGGGGLPGAPGQSTPFAPKVLVRFGEEPVQFTYRPYAAASDVVVVDPTKDGDSYKATVDIPAGATSVYVMIGNAGQSDGAYKAMKLTFNSALVLGGGEGGAGGEEPTTTAKPGQQIDGGCGCSVPSPGGADGAFAALVLAGLGLARRRRSGR
jgi:MYXO-CTERM domain-containing protein